MCLNGPASDATIGDHAAGQGDPQTEGRTHAVEGIPAGGACHSPAREAVDPVGQDHVVGQAAAARSAAVRG